MKIKSRRQLRKDNLILYDETLKLQKLLYDNSLLGRIRRLLVTNYIKVS